MNRLVLIGNGFDLAHGLKTRYQDFIDWYWEQRYAGLKNCYESPVLAIWREEGELKVVIDEPSNLPLSDDMVQYPIDEVILNEVDSMTPNYDRISAIANEWIFIEH